MSRYYSPPPGIRPTDPDARGKTVRISLFCGHPFFVERDSLRHWTRRLGLEKCSSADAIEQLLEIARCVPALSGLPAIVPLVGCAQATDNMVGCPDPRLAVAILSRCSGYVFIRDRPPLPWTCWPTKLAWLAMPEGWTPPW